jgi:hypothetical protein
MPNRPELSAIAALFNLNHVKHLSGSAARQWGLPSTAVVADDSYLVAVR